MLISLHKIFPEAPIYALFYDKKFIFQYLPKAKVISSFLQKIPNIKKIHPWFKILMPVAAESLDLTGFDMIISSSHEVSHGVLTKQHAKHICFYHSPSRILWDRTHEYLEDFKKRGRGGFKLFLIKLGQHFLRLWDWSAGQRPDIVVANSKHVAERIKKYYGREAKVIYPPVEINPKHEIRNPKQIQNPKFKTVSNFDIRISNLQSKNNYFLIVCQLYPHKNIDLAIEAFKNLPELNLVIVGDGPEKNNLKFKIQNLKLRNVKLLGFVPDEELPYYYQNCLAYLICNEEDFGISPIEAMSLGKPVLAYKKGGAAETVLEGVTGEFFDEPKADNLSRAARSISKKIENDYYSDTTIKKHSEKFGFERFKKEMLDLVENLRYTKK